MAGVVLLEGKVYSHHSSDLLNNGRAHDAFSLFTLLEQGGDVRVAVREAAQVLSLTLKVQPSRKAGTTELAPPKSYRARMYARLRGVV